MSRNASPAAKETKARSAEMKISEQNYHIFIYINAFVSAVDKVQTESFLTIFCSVKLFFSVNTYVPPSFCFKVSISLLQIGQNRSFN